MNKNLSIIIPIYNESKLIDNLNLELNKFFKQNDKLQAEIIFVDDGSVDSSFSELKKIKHQSYAAKIVRLSKNYGSHAALRAGVFCASAQTITFLSADLQEPLENVLKMFKKINEGYDYVIAERKEINSGIINSFFTKFYALLMRKFVSEYFPKNGFDSLMFNEKIKKELNDKPEANSSVFLQIISFGFSRTSILYARKQRKIGKSKWKISRKIDLVIGSFVSFSHFPIKFVSFIGISFSFLGFIWAGYVFLRAMISKNLTPGWPSLIAILMLGFGVTNVSLGIISEYLRRTYDASLGRKTYIIDSVISL